MTPPRALAALLLLLVCQACAAQNLPLWEVRSETATVYLLGSVHVLTEDAYPLPQPIETAFQAADVAVFEVDLAASSTYEAALLMQRRGTYTAPRSIETELSDDTRALLAAYAKESDLDLTQFQRVKPWLISLQIGLTELSKLGFSANHGVDIHYQTRARALGKPIVALETFEQQVELLAGDPPEVQELALQVALSQRGDMPGMIKRLIADWRAGDAQSMYQLSLRDADEYPSLKARMTKLLDHRNNAMAGRIRTFLAGDKTWFVVVGALHMGGDHGLLKLLGGDFKVRQLSNGAAR